MTTPLSGELQKVALQLAAVTAAPLTYLGSGDFCHAFRAGEIVYRVARHANAAAAMHRETCVLAEIGAEMPLAVPRLEIDSRTDRHGTITYTWHRMIVGEVLSRDRWEAFASEARERLARQLGEFLAALHRISASRVDDCRLSTVTSTTLATRIRRHSGSRQPDGNHRHLETLLAAIPPDPSPPSILHMDIAPGHVLLDDTRGQLTGVIDFGDVALGDRRRDFIYVLEDFGEQMLQGVLRGYSEDSLDMLAAIRAWRELDQLEWDLCSAQTRRAPWEA